MLSLLVPDIDKTVDELVAKGVAFERRGVEPRTDDQGIHRNPPVHPVAWILSVIEA